MAYKTVWNFLCIENLWGKPTLVGLHCMCICLLAYLFACLNWRLYCNVNFNQAFCKNWKSTSRGDRAWCHIECPLQRRQGMMSHWMSTPEETGYDVTLNVHVQRRQDMMSHWMSTSRGDRAWCHIECPHPYYLRNLDPKYLPLYSI